MSEYTNNLFTWTSENNAWVILYNFVPEGSRVLDVGCSSGNFGEVLIHEKRCEVIGLDIDEADVKIAQKKLTGAEVRNIEQDDVSDLGMFDVVIFADVIEHLMQPATALQKVSKVLKKNGRILFSIPNMAHVSTRLRLLEGSFDYTPTGILDRTHLHYYDDKEVGRVFTDAQLKIEQLTPTTITFTKDMLEQRLAKLGLKASKGFYEHLEATKSNIYQFVGYATPSTKRVSNKEPHYVFPIDEVRDEMQRISKLAQDHARNLEAIIKQKDKRIAELTNELSAIKNSKTWKLAHKLATAKRKVTR